MSDGKISDELRERLERQQLREARQAAMDLEEDHDPAWFYLADDFKLVTPRELEIPIQEVWDQASEGLLWRCCKLATDSAKELQESLDRNINVKLESTSGSHEQTLDKLHSHGCSRCSLAVELWSVFPKCTPAPAD
mgnify:CR=1 FL=1